MTLLLLRDQKSSVCSQVLRGHQSNALPSSKPESNIKKRGKGGVAAILQRRILNSLASPKRSIEKPCTKPTLLLLGKGEKLPIFKDPLRQPSGVPELFPLYSKLRSKQVFLCQILKGRQSFQKQTCMLFCACQSGIYRHPLTEQLFDLRFFSLPWCTSNTHPLKTIPRIFNFDLFQG